MLVSDVLKQDVLSGVLVLEVPIPTTFENPRRTIWAILDKHKQSIVCHENFKPGSLQKCRVGQVKNLGLVPDVIFLRLGVVRAGYCIKPRFLSGNCGLVLPCAPSPSNRSPSNKAITVGLFSACRSSLASCSGSLRLPCGKITTAILACMSAPS